MKLKLTRRKLLGSLVFPIIVTVWAIFKYLFDGIIYGDFGFELTYRWSFVIAVAVGGILPVILTIAMEIDTAQYFLPRLLIYVGTLGFMGIVRDFVTDMSFTHKLVMLLVSLIFSALFFYKIRPTKFSEWVVIFLSNPILYSFIYNLILMNYIKTISERFADSL